MQYEGCTNFRIWIARSEGIIRMLFGFQRENFEPTCSIIFRRLFFKNESSCILFSELPVRSWDDWDVSDVFILCFTHVLLS